MITRAEVLKRLPPYLNKAELIEERQDVRDIIREVMDAHKHFASDYDEIAELFYTGDLEETAALIFDFLKDNVRYKVEPEELQTTKSPAAILVEGVGDCKHYAGFIAGVLSAINRKYGAGHQWRYRFASYKVLDDTPQHVFVVGKDQGGELWIDPVLSNLDERYLPNYFIDKKVSDMALQRVSGFSVNSVAGLPQPVRPSFTADLGKYSSAFSPFLGLSSYISPSILLTNWKELASEITALIAQGPSPGHVIDDGDLKWLYTVGIPGWNLYFEGGVAPNVNFDAILEPHYPRPVITPDGRLAFNKMLAIDGEDKALQVLTMWVQDMINKFDGEPFPIKPEQVQAFARGKYGGPGEMNMFNQVRGQSIFKQIGKALEDAVNFVKDGVLKIVGSIPRNAMLGLIGLNVFGWASSLWEKIQAGRWEEMAKTWKKVGGNPDKFRNTIEHGKDKAAILGYTDQGHLLTDGRGNAVGEPATGTGVAAWLAAASPIIAILMKYLDKDGKAGEVAGAVKTSLENIFPGVKIAIGDSLDFLDANTGKPIQWVVDPADDENLGGGNDDMPGGFSDFARKNAIILAGGAAAVTYMVTNKRGRKTNYLTPLAVGAFTFLIAKFR